MLCISVSALGRNTATCIFLTPAWGSVHWVLTHTVSIFVHRFFPQFLVFVFYVTNFKFSYHCLSMPCVSSLLSLSGLALAPPSGPSATVIGQSTWQLSWHKKPKKIERSPLTSHHPAKRNTNTNHINIIQFSLFLCSKIAFERGEIKHVKRWAKHMNHKWSCACVPSTHWTAVAVAC